MLEMRNAYKVLVGKPEEKRPLGRSMRRMDLKEIWWEVLDWIQLIQGRFHKRRGI
jgi:hypothetical protein